MSRTQELAVILLLVGGGVCSLVRSCEQFIRSSVSIEITITCFLIFNFPEHSQEASQCSVMQIL